MRKYLLIFLLVAIVLVAGCTGSPSGGGESGTYSKETPTATPTESSTHEISTTTQETSGSNTPISGIADFVRKVKAEGIKSDSYRAVKLTAPEGKFLYYPYYHYNDEAFLLWGKYVLIYSPYDGNYLSGKSDKPKVELEGIAVLPSEVKLYYPNPEDSYPLMVGTDGKLRVLKSSGMVEVNGVDVLADSYETLAEYDFNADGILITGEYDENDNFHYEFVAWKGNELRVYAYTEDELKDKAEVQPVVYTLPSKILDVPFYDSEVLYVSAEDGFYIIPKPFSGYERKAYKVSDLSLFAPVIEWNGNFVVYGSGKMSWIRAGLGDGGAYVNEKFSTPVQGIISLYGPYMTGNGIAVASFSNGNIGIYGIYSTLYGSDEDKIEAIGWLDLKVPLKAFSADYNTDSKRLELIGIGNDGSLYAVAGNPVKGAPPGGGTSGTSGGTQTKTQTGTPTETPSETQTGTATQTETQTSTSTPQEKNELLKFYNEGLTVSGFSFTKDGYSYTGIKVEATMGRLLYFPYGDESYLYVLWNNYLRRVYPWNAYSDYEDGGKPEISGGMLEELPGVPKVMFIPTSNGDEMIMVDQNGKLHILLGLKRENRDGLDVYTFKSDVVYDFDAEGVSIGSASSGYQSTDLYIAWKGKELRVYPYSSDDVYKMWDEGKEIRVEPVVYTIPSEILEVNPRLDDDFLVVRAKDGVYLVPKPGGHYSDDNNVYRVFGSAQLIGAHNNWAIYYLLVYSNGKLYSLDCEYSESDRSIDVTITATLDVPRAVYLYGENDGGEENVLLSLDDGTLSAYTYEWDDAKQSYVFKHLVDFYPGVVLKSFRSDYRPDNKWIQVNGIGTDGAFYIFEAQG